MPAERTRGSKRSDVEGMQLTWTVPVEPSSPQSIAFAPNVTPITFNDPPSPVELACEPVLFPDSNDSLSRRPGHGRKKPDNHIPRPPNAFILFRSSFIKSQHVSTEVETNHSTLSKIIGLTWQSLPPEERQIWHAKAKVALEEHRRKWPQYAFRPSHTKGGGAGGTEKRKVREVEPKDARRCAKIAQLLVEGKKGQELDAAIQEFDRHHVPEVVTRFEAPITARAYRRSSSAPVDDALTKEPFLPSSPRPTRRPRCSSTQPSRYSSPPPKFEDQPPVFACDIFSEKTTSQSSELLYTLPPKPEPSYDPHQVIFDSNFNDFLTQSSPISDHYSHYYTNNRMPSPSLTIDTSVSSDWALYSSPPSSIPATPQTLPSACVSQLTPDIEDVFSLNAFALDSRASVNPYPIQSIQMPMPMHSKERDMYSWVGPDLSDDPLTPCDYQLQSFSKEPLFEPAGTDLTNIDWSFFSFMDSSVVSF